ncbi:sugar phosphate isomerase/epimerase [Lewinella aquimaris]|uniref:Sugar phosphate isomerase/epimerase n=1 Tax=Neolewinella aquimaris TaxID=1835722 RepID=A0A840E7H9_9BACT|nr:TIM barrel protein [Neolewinella aquimaris]MBB4077759.1 sugar phosphate isomerase/epimerase [Neolewinella aquimaris]
MQNQPNNRRNFLRTTALATAGLMLGAPRLSSAPALLKHYNKPDSLINGVQIGTITYSFRSMPDQSAEATLQYVLDSGMSAIELMGDPAETFAGRPENPVDRSRLYGLFRKQRGEEGLTEDETRELDEMRAEMDAYNKEVAKWRATADMNKFVKVREMYADAGVNIYAFKPRAFEKDNSDEEINFGMQAARALGASHVTLEHPADDARTLKLGKMAKQNKVRIAYHGHEQQTPTFWDTALKQSKGNAMNLDIGHYVATGHDPIAILKAHHGDIMSMHLKDRQTPENGKGNLMWGKGDTPIGDVLRLMSAEKYKFPATVELEYDIPEGSDAVKEVARCLAYCREQLTDGKG